MRYFAWLRERVGAPSETVETAAATVAELVDELAARDEALRARPSPTSGRCGWRSTRSWPTSRRRSPGVREVAFFPPMTGG